jgi:hypothetical protein
MVRRDAPYPLPSEAPEVQVEEVDQDIVRYPGFMQYLYQKKLTGAENLTKSEGLNTEIETWKTKERQAREELNKQ